MAVPKKRTSHSRSKMRRSINDRLTPVQVSYCPECGEPKLPHHACVSCGKYKAQQVIKVEEYTAK
ncbi:MAG: 50S ribosomal protein L32 [Bradymonadales bacterium]|jgi:large subunit ribosomal protein L32